MSLSSQSARLTLHPDFAVGDIDPRIYGSFIEHVGRAVYGGIYEPGHPSADSEGFRDDVADLVRELDVPIVRYPGGNFVSGYRWEDGVGPVEKRPRRLDGAWQTTESNAVGVNEFAAWCRKVDTQIMMAVNMGTRGIDAACDLLEYCNHKGGTYLSDLRNAHGARDPHNIKLWCLGNEMDGPWQTGHKSADDYGKLALATGAAMKMIDSSIELVVCGSSGAFMSTFPAWEATVLEHTYDTVDYISLHTYLGNAEKDRGGFLAKSLGMDRFISEVSATCDHIQARKRSKKQMNISFDEWNVWYHTGAGPDGWNPNPWSEAPPLIEDAYTFEDALVVGCMIITLLRHADRVKIACLAQLVNVIAPIMTVTGGAAWRQTIYYPYLHASRYGRGKALNGVATGPTYEATGIGDVPLLEQVAVLSEDGRSVTVFAVNRSADTPLPLQIDMRAFANVAAIEHITLTSPDPLAVNTADAPDRVTPRALALPTVDTGRVSAVLPALSWNVIRLAVG